MLINELAKISGVTVRTLHYYDKIGLLKPTRVTDTGYRIYNDDSLALLQQILFFKELDFPLEEIKEIISTPGYNRNEAFSRQRELLLCRRNRLDGLIELADKIIRGENNMSFKEFDTSKIDAKKAEYAKEAKERWGSTSEYKEYQQKHGGSSDETAAEGNDILRRIGLVRSLTPQDDRVQQLVAEWHKYINDNYYTCSKQMLMCLGQMYVSDKRFEENIDKNGEGTAQLLSKAIEIYCAE